jgi:DNA-binding transcriptional LysR family regulator
VQDAEAKLSFRQAEPQGRLAVTASVLFGRRYVAPIVSEFIRRHRDVNVEMLFVDRIANVVEKVWMSPSHRTSPGFVAGGDPARFAAQRASLQYLRRHGMRAHRRTSGACGAGTLASPRNEWNFGSAGAPWPSDHLYAREQRLTAR